MSLGNGLPLADWRTYTGDKDIVARQKADLAYMNAVRALQALSGMGGIYARGKTTGKAYKVVVFEDMGGPQIGIED